MKKLALFLSLFFIGAVSNAVALPYNDLLKYGSTNIVDRIGDRTTASSGYDATYFGYLGANWSGYYLGTVEGNDNKVLEGVIQYYWGNTDSVAIDKIDAPFTTSEGSLFTMTYAPDEKSGTWATTNQSTNAIEFYAVKGSTEWALYFLNPALASGIWTTSHLLTSNEKNTPTVSHISATFTGPAPVPEPATMLLFGTGLAALAGLRLRKKK